MRKTHRRHERAKPTVPPLPSAQDFPAPVPAEVVAAVQQLYRAFAQRRAPTGHLNACTSCCMDPALEREMRALPLRAVTAHHLWEYQDAAHEQEQDTAEYAWFLPRVAEFMSHGDLSALRHSSEIALERLGGCTHTEFSHEEYAAIIAWLFALWHWYWKDAGSSADRNVALLHESASTWLVMLDRAQVPLAPFLAAWQSSDSDWAMLQYAQLCLSLNGQKHFNAFADERPALRQTLSSWADSPEVYRHFAQHWAALSDERVDELLSGHRVQVEHDLLGVLGPREPMADNPVD